MGKYVPNRQIQCVSGLKNPSPDVCLNFGVAQVSVLGLKYFCLYTKSVGEIIEHHNIEYHCYTDDTQEYMTIKSCDKGGDISSSIVSSIIDIGIWMNGNMLKFSKDKTKYTVLSSKQHVKKTEGLYKFFRVCE